MRAEPARRWPLHPQPAPGEALTSWLAGLAALYGLSTAQLLRHNLGPASALLEGRAFADLDWDPPVPVLEALAERTGTSLGELRMMTIAGWRPWLADSLDPADGPEAFATYVRQGSVLLAPGEARAGKVGAWLAWLPTREEHRRAVRMLCPVCTTDPDAGTTLLAAALPIMTSCPVHTCRLEPGPEVRSGLAIGKPVAPQPVPDAVTALDRLTWEGLTTGRVSLPRRPVHAGVWFRLLRTLLDEVSMAPSVVRSRSAEVLRLIWERTGQPLRAGLNVWRPFEQLGPARQEAMREAAAIVVDLARTETITMRGTFGPLLSAQPHQAVFEGHRPPPPRPAEASEGLVRASAWGTFNEEFEAFFGLARNYPGTALQLLKIFAFRCRTLAEFETERRFLINAGIPEAFLPDAAGCGRADLLTGR